MAGGRKALTIVLVLAVVIGIAGWWSPRHDEPARPMTGGKTDDSTPRGTSGVASEKGDSKATLTDIQEIGATGDAKALVGSPVKLHVTVADIGNYSSFWTGPASGP